MKYMEYAEMMKKVKVPEGLEFKKRHVLMHPRSYRFELNSLGTTDSEIIKVPPRTRIGHEIEHSVLEISPNAFGGNEKITDIILPSTISFLKEGAFAGCRSLKNIVIPGNIRNIYEGTFAGCTSLENIYFGGTRAEWFLVNIVHERHEVEFGPDIPGTPVRTILSDCKMHIPGNDAVLTANIHFNCDPALCYEE